MLNQHFLTPKCILWPWVSLPFLLWSWCSHHCNIVAIAILWLWAAMEGRKWETAIYLAGGLELYLSPGIPNIRANITRVSTGHEFYSPNPNPYSQKPAPNPKFNDNLWFDPQFLNIQVQNSKNILIENAIYF